MISVKQGSWHTLCPKCNKSLINILIHNFINDLIRLYVKWIHSALYLLNAQKTSLSVNVILKSHDTLEKWDYDYS